MRDGNNQCNLTPKNKCKVVWEARKVYAPPSLVSKPPQEWVLNNSCTRILNLVTKPSTETWNLGLIVARDALNLGLRPWMKL